MLIIGRNTICLPALKILSIILRSKQYINNLHVLSPISYLLLYRFRVLIEIKKMIKSTSNILSINL
jgi:hypothetical protein